MMQKNLDYEALRAKVKNLETEVLVLSQKEKGLNLEKAYLEHLLDSAPEAIILCDEYHHITRTNAAFTRMFGYSQEEALGKMVDDLIASGEVYKESSEITDRVGQGEPVSLRTMRFRKDGSPVYVDLMAIPVRYGDKSRALYASYRDITHRKQMEEELKESYEKLKMFAYSVSHDLKSPTISLYGFTKRLHKDYIDFLDEKGQKYCDLILKTSEQIVSLIEQVNVFISTKEAVLTIETLDVKEVLKMIREEFSTRLNIREIKWSEPDLIPEIRADRLSILRALRNLVDNALKYGGEELSEIDIGYKELNDAHVLSVKDNGIGLKKQKYHQDIFMPFIRKKTSKGIEGSGLGLAILREIAEKHGGQVWLEPGKERGMTFYLTISKR